MFIYRKLIFSVIVMACISYMGVEIIITLPLKMVWTMRHRHTDMWVLLLFFLLFRANNFSLPYFLIFVFLVSVYLLSFMVHWLERFCICLCVSVFFKVMRSVVKAVHIVFRTPGNQSSFNGKSRILAPNYVGLPSTFRHLYIRSPCKFQLTNSKIVFVFIG